MAIAKKRSFHLILGVCTGLGIAASPALADKSPALQRTEQAASQIDLTGNLNRESDALSRSLYLGREALSHAFEIERGGDYEIEVRAPNGSTGAYRVNAELRDANGTPLAEGRGDETSEGVRFQRRLEPGRYEVVVSGRSSAPARERVDTVTVTVNGADARRVGQGLSDESRVARLAPSGDTAPTRQADAGALEQDAALAGTGRSQRSASQTAAPDGPPPAPGPSGQALEEAVTGSETQAPNAAQTEAPAASRTAPASETSVEPARERILRTVPIRTDAEVLKFEVIEAGTVTIESFTTDQSSNYRIAGEILDAEGRVVARDSGRGFQGDFSIRERLEPGIYSVRVEGRKSGSAGSGANSFTLRVEQSAP